MRRIIGIGLIASFSLLTSAAAAPRDPRPVAASFLDRNGRPVEARTEGLEPRALVTADFDEDGIADVAALLSDQGRSRVALLAGNADALYPFEPAARRRTLEHGGDAPSLQPLGPLFDLPVPADVIGAGDFDDDGHADLVLGAEGGRALFLLRGDGHGGLSDPIERRLEGRLEQMAVGEINRPDALADIVVAVDRGGRHEIEVFEGPEGAWSAAPEAIPIDAPATVLALGDLDGDFDRDLVVGVRDGMRVVHGRDRNLSLDRTARAAVEAPAVARYRLDFTPRRAALGRFAGAARLALLGDDGALRLAASGTLASSRVVARGRGTGLLLAAHAGVGAGDDLVTLDAGGWALTTLEAGSMTGSDLPLGATPVAALPLRLGPSADTSLVVLNGAGPALLSIIPPAAPTTFTVTTIADGGPGSLRSAILSANANPGADTINFNITPNALLTITPATPLPDITDPVTIDGTTQPGYAGTPLVELDGGAVPPSTSGLVVRAGPSVVRGLDIHGFPGSGVVIDGGGHNVVEGNFIGLDHTGTAAVANQDGGVVIRNSHLNTIGGTAAAARNVISGNAQAGVAIRGPSTFEQEYDSQGAAVAICDLCTVTMPIVITDEKLIDDVNVQVNLTHTFDSDLVLTLVAPDSTRVVLARQRGGGGDNYTGTLFDDGAATPISSGVAPFGGSYRPEEPLSILNGRALNGTWTLEVQDTASGDVGALLSWNMTTEGETIYGNLVEGNLIGTDRTGTIGIGNTKGVVIDQSPLNVVGGTAPGARNVISGGTEQSAGHGVEITGNPALNALHNQVLGNYIGTDITGTRRLPNLVSGIDILYADGCQIGGTAAGAGNLISANGQYGVHTQVSSFDRIQGNTVGPDVTGSVAMSLQTGIFLDSATTNCVVGGSVAAARNQVSGNGGGIQTNGIAPNSFSNVIQGNYVGTDPTGTQAVPNAYHGILIDSPLVQVGGPGPGEGNLISGNNSDPAGYAGLALHPEAQSCTVQGNIIGLDRTATVPLGNDRGLLLNAGAYNRYGGTNPGEGNIIAGNRTHGVWIFDPIGNGLPQQEYSADTPKAIVDLATVTSSISASTGAQDLLEDIKVHVDLTHTFDSDLILTLIAPNGARVTLARNRGASGDNYIGTAFDDGSGTPIGSGAAPFSGAYQPEEPLAALSGISTAGTWTLEIADVAGGDSGTLFDWWIDFDYVLAGDSNYQAQVLGNFIGTNALGMAGLGNGGDGVFGQFSNVTQIGMPGGGNVISGNAGHGLSINSPFCAANIVQSNLIGLKPDGTTPLGNGSDGLVVSGPVGLIGGPSPAYGNVIAYNAGAGVNVAGSASLRQTTIRGNSIHHNGGLGIDLAPIGVTPNDAGDTDFGANLLQNFPSIASVVPQVMNSVLISGTLQSTPNSKFTIDLYGNAQADPSGYGEGRTWLGTGSFTTDGTGNASWSLLTSNGALGLIAATATDFAGNTSEFSGLAKSPQEASPAKDMKVAPGSGGTLNFTYAPACGATDHVLYWGTMGPGMMGPGGMNWTSAACGLGTSGTANVVLFNPPVGKGFFFTIAGQNGTVEGSYGQDSNGAEEPEATFPVVCNLPQFLGGGCF